MADAHPARYQWRPPDALAQAGIRRRQLLQTPRNALARNAGGAGDRRDATAPQALRFSRRQAPLTFVQKQFQAHKTYLTKFAARAGLRYPPINLGKISRLRRQMSP